MSISRADANNLSFAYFINRVNQANDTGGPAYGRDQVGNTNSAMLEPYPNPPSQAYLGDRQSGPVQQANLVIMARDLAAVFANVVRGIYGIQGNWPPAFSGTDIFYVSGGYHAGHYNQLRTWIDQAYFGEISGTVTQWGIATYLDRLANLIINAKNNETVDLRICHGSCHLSCHSSRGRR